MEDKIKSFISKHNVWHDELVLLRALLTNTVLEERMKWGMPSYECNSQNVIGIGAFKNHIGIWFHQGALLSDPENILINAQQGKTKAMRSIQITKGNPIDKQLLCMYIAEAIENALEGKKMAIAKPRKVDRQKMELPIELREVMSKDSKLQEMFKSLTAIQQYDYMEYIASAKRATTKASRLEQILPLIKVGKPISAKWEKK